MSEPTTECPKCSCDDLERAEGSDVAPGGDPAEPRLISFRCQRCQHEWASVAPGSTPGSLH